MLQFGRLIMASPLILQFQMHSLESLLLLFLHEIYVIVMAEEVTHQGNLVSNLLFRAIFVFLFVFSPIFFQPKSLIVNIFVLFIAL